MKKVICSIVFVVGLIIGTILLGNTTYNKSITIPSIEYPKNYIDTFVICGGTFDLDINVLITQDTTIAVNYAKSLFNNDSNINASDFLNRGITLSSGDYTTILLWLPKIPKSPEEISILNHEVFHVVRCIMLWSGTPLSEDTDEAWAYETGYISKQIYEHIQNK